MKIHFGKEYPMDKRLAKKYMNIIIVTKLVVNLVNKIFVSENTETEESVA